MRIRIASIGLLGFTMFLYAGQTSLSDETQYVLFCQEAVGNDVLFTQFRNQSAYTGIVETVSFEQGQEYLEIIQKESPELLELVERFKTSDLVGNPRTYYYAGIGNIAPTTLRYIKVAADLKKLFGSLEQLSIVEIGAGYGGQCKILKDLGGFKKYTIIDLPSSLALAKKFLTKHNIADVEFLTPFDVISDQMFDLVISNYAFSECSYEMQRRYVQEIFCRSRRGYCICNVLSGSVIGSKQGILGLLNASQIPWKECAEEPLTWPNNYLLLWSR